MSSRRSMGPMRNRQRASAFAIGCILIALPSTAHAQIDVTIEGRVFDANSGSGIPVATVELVGHGSTLTSDDGSFRFDGVELGAYTLRTASLGYSPDSRLLRVSDMTVSVRLVPAPLVLDSVGVNIRRIEVRGRVRDPENDFNLVDASILTDQPVMARTDSHGRFRLRGVLENVPLTVRVRAFGYRDFMRDLIARPTHQAQ